MRKVSLNIPENQYSFFLELMKNLGFISEKKDDFVLSSAHKKILDQRIKDMKENPNDVVQWSSVKKEMLAKIKKKK